MTLSIRQLTENDVSALLDHYGRHCAESGSDGDEHFLRADPSEIVTDKFNYEAFRRGFSEPGWRRWQVAVDDDLVIGHADLRGDPFRSGLHRCELAMGVERSYRGRGIGRKLMVATIELARTIDVVEWIDLRVHANNKVARSLYESLGFREVVIVEDRFRFGAEKVSDVLMTLRLS